MSLKQYVLMFEQTHGRCPMVRKFANQLIGGKLQPTTIQFGNQDIHMKKGGLRQMLNLQKDQKLNISLLDKILTTTNVGETFILFGKSHTLTKLMKKRMQFAKVLMTRK